MKITVLSIVVLAWVAASCGSGSGSSGASLDFDGFEVVPFEDALDSGGLLDGLPGNETKDSSDLLAEDGDLGGEDLGGDGGFPDTRPDDTIIPDTSDEELLQPECEPGALLCDKGELYRCNPLGTAATLVDDCDDNNVCTDDWCVDGECTHDQGNPDCCNPACETGEVCVSGDCMCAPQCVGKECGPNGCGGQCGSCGEGETCSVGGLCECTPVCEGLVCGDDGCGGVCGECPAHHECQAGTCVCVPNCVGLNCGDDGCGGTCGTCDTLLECVSGVCTFTCSTCPTVANCQQALFGLHAYYFCTSQRSWDSADGKCGDFGAELVTVNNAQENDFLFSQTGGQTYWIGYHQDWLGRWKWDNDEEPGYEHWDEGQPDDGSFWTIEDCTTIWGNGYWNDDQCGTDYNYICEYVP